MFDIGFAELIIIGVVALIVIGPERLPEAVRTASAWLNRLRRGFNDIKQEVQQELHNDSVLRDLRETGEELRRESSNLQQSLQAPLSEARATVESLTQEEAKAPTTTNTDSASDDSGDESSGKSSDSTLTGEVPEKPNE